MKKNKLTKTDKIAIKKAELKRKMRREKRLIWLKKTIAGESIDRND